MISERSCGYGLLLVYIKSHSGLGFIVSVCNFQCSSKGLQCSVGEDCISILMLSTYYKYERSFQADGLVSTTDNITEIGITLHI